MKSMNYLWAGMIFCGIIFAAFHGTLPEVTEAAINSAKEAVELCIMVAGVLAFWLGLMAIAENSGMLDHLTRKMKPLLQFLFPRIPKDHKAFTYLAANMTANLLGLGWAATPAGLLAMHALADLEEERRKTKRQSLHPVPTGTASTEMCTFLIINISSLQLIPVNIIAYRSQYGSVYPASIIGPAIFATCISTMTAIIFCKIMESIQ